MTFEKDSLISQKIEDIKLKECAVKSEETQTIPSSDDSGLALENLESIYGCDSDKEAKLKTKEADSKSEETQTVCEETDNILTDDDMANLINEEMKFDDDNDSKASDFMILSILNAVIMLCMGSYGFFLAVPAFYYSVRTIEANVHDESARAHRAASTALNLNCLAIVTTMSEFFLFPHLGFFWEMGMFYLLSVWELFCVFFCKF